MLQRELEPLISARAGAVPSPVQGSNCTGCGFPERGRASPAPSDWGRLSNQRARRHPGRYIFAGFSDQGLGINPRRVLCHCLCSHKGLPEAAPHPGRHPLFCAALGAPSGRPPAGGCAENQMDGPLVGVGGCSTAPWHSEPKPLLTWTDTILSPSPRPTAGPVSWQGSQLSPAGPVSPGRLIWERPLGWAIQPAHPLSSPYPPAFNLSQHQGLF